MALTVAGHLEQARAAYRWLERTQLADGSWFNYYVGDAVKDARLDTNVCAYLATGVYHYLLATGDEQFAHELWPSVTRALDFVVRWQHPMVTGRVGATRVLRAAHGFVVDLSLTALRGGVG